MSRAGSCMRIYAHMAIPVQSPALVQHPHSQTPWLSAPQALPWSARQALLMSAPMTALLWYSGYASAASYTAGGDKGAHRGHVCVVDEGGGISLGVVELHCLRGLQYATQAWLAGAGKGD